MTLTAVTNIQTKTSQVNTMHIVKYEILLLHLNNQFTNEGITASLASKDDTHTNTLTRMSVCIYTLRLKQVPISAPLNSL